MSISYRIILYILLAIMLCFFQRSILYAGGQEFDIEDILIAVQASRERLSSGKGVLEWKKTGDYFGIKDEKTNTVKIEYAFDEDKIRSDIYHPDGTLLLKKAINPSLNSEISFENKTSGKPTANIQELHNDYGGWITASEFDYRRLYESLLRDKSLLQAIQSGKYKVSVTKDKDGLFIISAVSENNTGTEVEICLEIDPARDFTITKELVIANGQTINEITRIVKEDNGMFLLKELKWTHYGYDNDSDLYKGMAGETIITVNEFQANIDIEKNTFSFLGFDLPPDTKIYDKIREIDYTLDPLQSIENLAINIEDARLRTVADSDEINHSIFNTDESEDEKKVSEVIEEIAEIEENKVSDNTQNALGRTGNNSMRNVVMGIGGIFILSIIAVFAIKKKQAEKRLNSTR